MFAERHLRYGGVRRFDGAARIRVPLPLRALRRPLRAVRSVRAFAVPARSVVPEQHERHLPLLVRRGIRGRQLHDPRRTQLSAQRALPQQRHMRQVVSTQFFFYALRLYDRVVCFEISETGCVCPQGYEGSQCQSYNPCWNDPCRNGATCTRTDSSDYLCVCPAGYRGRALFSGRFRGNKSVRPPSLAAIKASVSLVSGKAIAQRALSLIFAFR